MRIELQGVHRDSTEITFEFEGEPVFARPGETLAAALLNAGHRALRESHVFADKRTGVFCGMGICGECSVLVNGARRRACLEPAAPGLKVVRHPAHAPIAAIAAPHAPSAPFAAPAGAVTTAERAGAAFPREHTSGPCLPEALPESTLTPDVLVVGAGPAGLSAARAAASAGLEVRVVDERRAPGGQYFKQPNAGFDLDPERLDAQFRAGRALVESVRRSGAQLIPQATVWGAFAPWQVAAQTTLGQICVTTPTQRLKIQPRRLVIATGAYERGVPFPGWDLPGVMTTGAAQTLLRASQLAPGSRVLIAGNGPLNFQVAREMANAGVEVVALAEAAARPGLTALPSLVRMAASSPQLISAGLRDVIALRRRGVRVCHGHALTRVRETQDRHATSTAANGRFALVATISRIDEKGFAIPNTERHCTVDAVCAGYGFLPQSELARALGCIHAYDLRRGGLIVQRDSECRTSVPEVFIVGDAGGLGGAHIAMSQGTLAGLAVARDLGQALSPSAERDAKLARRSISRHSRFQAALWSLFGAPLLLDQLADEDTPICRCEGVSKGTLATLIQRGDTSLGAIKRQCRAGMGGCQGRYCATLMAAMVSRPTGAPVTEADLFAPRPPFRPTPIGVIAASLPPAVHETPRAPGDIAQAG